MAVKYCVMCNEEGGHGRFGADALAEGEYCPICYRPVCRRHLSVVRWRWRESGELDATLICKECLRTYAHRRWDVFHRDWIT